VKVVTNPDFPKEGTITYELEEELSIGRDVDDEDYIFHRPFDVKVAADGKIFVLDWGDSTFKIYDNEGKYIRTIGGRGQGPGEFERLVFFSLGSDGNLYSKFGREYTPVENKYTGKPGQPKYVGVFNVINRRWLFDENNNIWIEMFTKDDPEEIVYDIFSPEGFYIKQVKVKHRINQLWEGKAYSLVQDEDGFVSMKRFKLVEITD